MSKHARATDPGTSQTAAVDVEASTLSTHKARVLAAILGAGRTGMTWKQAERVTGVLNCWRRCSDLLDDEAIIPTGETRVEPETGREERIYVTPEHLEGYQRTQLTLGDV